MKMRIVHRTTYYYEQAATTSHHEARLTPRQSETQRTLAHEIECIPAPATRRSRFDYFGNRTHYFGLAEPHRKLEVTAHSIVNTGRAYLPDFDSTPSWKRVAEILRTDVRRDVLQATQMRFASPLVPLLDEMRDYAQISFAKDRPVLSGAHHLMRRINQDFTYAKGVTQVSTPLHDVARSRRGVCQDFAHFMIGCLRSMGLAARYTSGYLRTLALSGQTHLVGADASHAWVAVWAPEHGWIDFDPTNDTCPGEEHITLAFGRDFSDATPLRGVILGGGQHRLEVSVAVEQDTVVAAAAAARPQPHDPGEPTAVRDGD